ncbi:unnamed protein product [Sphagnum jensenii]|uniref:Uncharacterized protein n=1 Tax=Sphagnum jensenii TaxID=128206 RepID=A0ABP1ANT9_9BRYO
MLRLGALGIGKHAKDPFTIVIHHPKLPSWTALHKLFFCTVHWQRRTRTVSCVRESRGPPLLDCGWMGRLQIELKLVAAGN